MDLRLHIVARDHGAPVVNAVAHRLVVAPHGDRGQAQFIDAPSEWTGFTAAPKTMARA
jgi:AraC family transcriptional regulator, transcriptional activator FtrA